MRQDLPDLGLSYYRVLSSLGAGGMGEVWLAEDTRLGRKVAIKLLPADATRNMERVRRFVQEARAASALNHPHIVTVHDIGESASGHFIVMELVAGTTLRRTIGDARHTANVLNWCTQMARALSAAHDAGITHRDLKPENIMVRDDGYIKLLDFGLARLAPGNDETTIGAQTMPGQIVGTIRYMSPEQACGDPVGPSSDVFSLGLVFYELASGRHPFAAATSAAQLHAIASKTPAVIDTDPPALATLIMRMLEKAPERRPTADDVVQGLVAIEYGPAPTGTPAPVSGFGGRPAIAVLPFDNLSNDPDQDYFADGLADELITRLSLWRTFPVIARNSSFAFKGRTADLKAIANDLGVRYVVQGSVRKAGTRIRIAAKLVDAATAQQVWTKIFDRELSDVFALQDELSEGIAAMVVSDLQRAEHASAERRPPDSLEAWGLYQRAIPLIHRFTREEMAEARRLLERAVALDPAFAPPRARLAEVAIWEVGFSFTDTPDPVLTAGLEQARRAVALDPMDPEGHVYLAWMLMTIGRIGEGNAALEEAKRGLELNPSSIWALTVHAWIWCMTGHEPELSVAQVERAMRLSPHDPAEFLFYDIGAAAHLYAGHYDSGLTLGRRLIALFPTYYWGYLWCAANSAAAGRAGEARTYIVDARRIQPDVSITLVRRALGAMAPAVEQSLTQWLRDAGLGE